MANCQGDQGRLLNICEPLEDVLGYLGDSELLDKQTTPAGVLFVADDGGGDRRVRRGMWEEEMC